MRYEFNEGVIWEDNPWYIKTNYEYILYGDNTCRHSHNCRTTKSGAKIYICPAVLIVYNEGGRCSTGLCLQCVIDAVSKIGKLIDK